MGKHAWPRPPNAADGIMPVWQVRGAHSHSTIAYMQLLASWTIDHSGAKRTIQLLCGDLARLPADQAVDILVVSAFADDYLPTPSSLIGSLDRAGLSVAALATSKAVDLREQFSCWLSQPVIGHFAFNRVLCIESGWRGTPPEITDDLFRALAPHLLTDLPNATVAMPLIGAGDQEWPPGQMTELILRAAVSWIHRGLPLKLLKIVVHSEAVATLAHEKFVELRRVHDEEALKKDKELTPGASEMRKGTRPSYDVFLSYCHDDLETAGAVKRKLEALRPGIRIFFDRTTLKAGASWLMQVAESLDNARRVAAVYTPHYWTSPSCKDEFTAALARQNDTGEAVLFPIYVFSARIPYLFQNIQSVDCREGDMGRLDQACLELNQAL